MKTWASRDMIRDTSYAPVRAPRGTELSCQGWQQEAALRMLMNCLDPEVAERPSELIVGAGVARPVRDGESFHAIAASLRELGNDQTLLVQSGAPAGVVPLQSSAPRVFMAGASVPGSVAAWTYTGSQLALLVAHETFGAVALRRFGGTLAGRLVIAGGMGGAGGAQALAATLHGAAFLGIDVDPERIKRRVKTGYCDLMVNDVDEALRILKNAVRRREAASVGLVGNCADVIPALAHRGVVPDLITDRTSAHDPVNGYIPNRQTIAQADDLRRRDPQEYRRRALDSIAAHVRGILEMRRLGAVAFDFGNGIGALACGQGVTDACDLPGFVAEYLQPALAEGYSPLQWVALSGDASDLARADRLAVELFPENDRLRAWLALAKRRLRPQGLPARAAWLSAAERSAFGIALNERVARGELQAPVVLSCEPIAPDAPASDEIVEPPVISGPVRTVRPVRTMAGSLA